MRIYLAVGVAVLAAIAVVVVACSDSTPKCTAGKLSLTVQLNGTAAFADTLTFTSVAPAINMTVAHEPGVSGDLTNVDVEFVSGYPADSVVTVVVRATGGITLLGEGAATVHLPPGCGTGFISVNASVTLDGSASD
jgi:hypothetical protein